jgi:hypothetical protein
MLFDESDIDRPVTKGLVVAVPWSALVNGRSLGFGDE